MSCGTLHSNLPHCGRIIWNVENHYSPLSTSQDSWRWLGHGWRSIHVHKIYWRRFKSILVHMVYCRKHLGIQQVPTKSNSATRRSTKLLQSNTLFVCILGDHSQLYTDGLNLFLYMLSRSVCKLYSILCYRKRVRYLRCFEDRLLLFKDQRDRISWEDKECHFLVFFWHKKKNVKLLVLVQ